MYKFSGFIPTDLKINSWQDLKPYYDKLQQVPIQSTQDLATVLIYFSELQSVFAEQSARAYIAMTCHTDDPELVKRHELFSVVIAPEVEIAQNEIEKQIVKNSFFEKLPDERYATLKRELKRNLEMFREANVELDAQLSKLASDYGQIAGAITAHIDGEDLPLPVASTRLESPDRAKRQAAWLAIQETRWAHKNQLDALFDNMIHLRHQVALNAGYQNHRDYEHDAKQRFDYSVDDVLRFHDAIEKHVVPLMTAIEKQHRDRLGLANDYRPWDTEAKPTNEKPLTPFTQAEELLTKTITIFSRLKTEFGDNLRAMQKAELFDLEARHAKAPGGYNYGLEVTGMPFIFMNAAGAHKDTITLMHEGGHAMHSFLTNSEPLIQYRGTPSEMAETASMGMELMSSVHWDEFYAPEDVKRARREHLEDIIGTFPWVAIVDAFQHWIYTNPQHSHDERDAHFNSLMDRFGTGLINWSDLEKFRRNLWQKQLHIFEVPFYYIEYAIAQIGALQVYRNFCKNPAEGLNSYICGLKLGSSKPLPQVWNAMNIRFDFSEAMLKDLMVFVKEELGRL